MRRVITGLALGLIIGLSLALVPGVDAQPPGLVTIFEALLLDHHKELAFSVDPGDSFSFELPEVQGPVRIDVSFSLLNGGTQTPSEIMYAVVNQDPESTHFTWVGTNSDGSQQGSNSIVDTDIAYICGGTCFAKNAVLQVDDRGAGTLKIWQNPGTTILTGNYIVNLWY